MSTGVLPAYVLVFTYHMLISFMQFIKDAGDGNLAAVNSFIAKYPNSINCQNSVSCGITLCNVYMYVYVGQYVCICPCLCVS